MRTTQPPYQSLCAALLFLAALSCPSDAHNGAVAIAVPVEATYQITRGSDPTP